MNEVKILRFINEELIAEVVHQNSKGKTITVKNPLRIVVVPNKLDQKNPSVGFAPYCEWIKDKELTLSTDLLIFIGEPLDVFTTQYKAQFSGIVLPESTIIT
jgi:hypothetical protein